MQIRRKHFVIGAIIIFTFILIRLIQSFFGGSLGLKPVAHGCLGAIIESKKILKIFPRGHFKLKIPIFLQYNVQPNFKMCREEFKYFLTQNFIASDKIFGWENKFGSTI